MITPVTKARVKFTLGALLVVAFVAITTFYLRTNLFYQIGVYLIVAIYFIFNNREMLKTFLNFTKFLLIVIVALHILIFIFKTISQGFEYSSNFYIERWELIVIRIFIIPNLFAFINILISKTDFIDIMLITNNNKISKVIYILLISGIEVMERLRIYYEYHPSNNTNKGIERITHYLAVPLTLFFGIYRGFENKYEILNLREEYFKE